MDFKVLLHPYRFLVSASLGEKEATVKELAEKLPEIPQAALYRCVQKLEEAKLIKRVSERKVRGAAEARYGLNFSMEGMKLNSGAVEDYLSAAYAVFFSFVYHKIAKYNDDTDQDKLQALKFHTIQIQLPEDQVTEFEEDVKALLRKYSTQGGNTYQLTTFLVPETNGVK